MLEHKLSSRESVLYPLLWNHSFSGAWNFVVFWEKFEFLCLLHTYMYISLYICLCISVKSAVLINQIKKNFA